MSLYAIAPVRDDSNFNIGLLESLDGIEHALLNDASPFKTVAVVVGIDTLHQARIHS